MHTRPNRSRQTGSTILGRPFWVDHSAMEGVGELEELCVARAYVCITTVNYVVILCSYTMSFTVRNTLLSLVRTHVVAAVAIFLTTSLTGLDLQP